MVSKAMLSSVSVEWETPQAFFDELNTHFAFTLDVCATPENAKCHRFYTKETNGLAHSWQGERCWMNPPYGREISHWVSKARAEAKAGALVVGLLPVRTDAKWWHENVLGHADVRFVKGRLKFGGETRAVSNSAPFGSAIAIWWGWPL